MIWLGEGENHSARMRQTLTPWRDRDLNGGALAMASLSARLTKVAAIAGRQFSPQSVVLERSCS